ncbi:hypothetical protein [Pseudonocardia spinosispora]|uniref:hypothetical protein n=1 Tax=Pseudonocardia spinosispora TaxID=103441 RepID=UPI0012EB8990|nr:hypothetical protein [Pseudonocardia spinosispora]
MTSGLSVGVEGTGAFAEQVGPGSWRVRYWTDDGVHGSLTGFTTREQARDKAAEIDVERRRGTFIDPAAGNLRLGEWAPRWLEALDVAEATESQYNSLTRKHIVPRWGESGVGDISGMDVHVWARNLRRAGYAESTVATIVKILSMMLADAADERLIVANPIRPCRRGRRRRERRREIVWATPEQALNAAATCGVWAGLMIVTAAWSGCRWGEICGLQTYRLSPRPRPDRGPVGDRS